MRPSYRKPKNERERRERITQQEKAKEKIDRQNAKIQRFRNRSRDRYDRSDSFNYVWE